MRVFLRLLIVLIGIVVWGIVKTQFHGGMLEAGVIAAVTIWAANAINTAFHKAPVDTDLSKYPSSQPVEPIPQPKSGSIGFQAFLALIMWGLLILLIKNADNASLNSTEEETTTSLQASFPVQSASSQGSSTNSIERDTGSSRQTSKCTEKMLSASELEKLKLATTGNSYELYNGNEFHVLNVKMRFQVKGREYPIERKISVHACGKKYCSLNGLIAEMNNWFSPKDYTGANGIPEHTMSYTVLSATRSDCQQ